MPSTNPLELPEILQNVANYVVKRSLPTCALVSNTWYQEFNPFIWKSIRLTKRKPTPPEAIQIHGHLVKILFISCTFSQEHLVLRFPRLVSLTMKDLVQDGPVTPQWISQHPTISQLSLSFFERDPPETLWDKLLELPHLKCLTLITINIRKKYLQKFWQLCTQLESLTLESPSIPIPVTLVPMDFPSIKEIRLDITGEKQLPMFLELLQKCPGLTAFTWNSWSNDLDDAFRSSFVSLVVTKGRILWPHLERLVLKTWGTTHEEACQIIGGMKRIVSLCIGSSQGLFGPNTVDQLRPHFLTLTELDLAYNNNATSAMAQEILSSCLSLVAFR
ncbi:hypothetical protein BGZ65_006152, partial [Modicella reniformis]